MLIRAEKPITKEQYDRAQQNAGFITDEDMEVIFTTSEICGYGIIGAVACAEYNKATGDNRYYARYTTSTTCD